VAVFMVFNLWIGGFFFNFHIFINHFPVTTCGLNLFSGECLNKLLYLWGAANEKSPI